jgi:multiple antibiotic resistance protein
MLEALTLIGGTIATLLPIANPFSTAPVFATITQGYTDKERKKQARMAVIYMIGVLLVTLFVGALVLKFFGVGIPALRIAGGLLIARVGFSMVNPEPPELVSDESESEAIQKQDIAFTPIAMPLLSGPGSMAATLSMASVAGGLANHVSIAIGICVVALISFLVLRSATLVANYLGVTGMDALTRVMGLLLVCIGIRFVATGLLEGLTDPRVIGPIVEAVRLAA